MIRLIGLVILAGAILLIVIFGIRLALSFRKLRTPRTGPRGFTLMTPSKPTEDDDVEVEWMKEKK